jgi:high-affinity nickel-transport protein
MLAVITQTSVFHAGLVVSAFGFGFRHGIDWDHLAALTDLTSGQTSRRRSLAFASYYALGHALVVAILGLLAIVAAEQLPAGVDTVMERFVGATLVALAVYVGYGLVRHGRAFRLRSRWMLLIAAVRRVGRRRPQSEVVVEHDHEHPVSERHDHTHAHAPTGALPGGGRSGADAPGFHSHPHQHRGHLPPDPFMSYAAVTAFGVGMLHGVGAETPTQVLVFLAAAGAGGVGPGVALLGCFIIGLLTANSLIALVAAFGQVRPERHFKLYVGLSVVMAGLSLVIGLLFLSGRASALPALLGG